MEIYSVVFRYLRIKEEVEKVMCVQSKEELKRLLPMQNKLTFQCGRAVLSCEMQSLMQAFTIHACQMFNKLHFFDFLKT